MAAETPSGLLKHRFARATASKPVDAEMPAIIDRSRGRSFADRTRCLSEALNGTIGLGKTPMQTSMTRCPLRLTSAFKARGP